MLLVKKINYIIFFILFIFLLSSFDAAYAQKISIDLGTDSHDTLFSNKMMQFIGLVTILSIAPSILIMVTSFTKIAVVLSILRHAIGLQQTPPTSIIISLALFLTFFIMAPTFHKSYEDGLFPLMNNSINEEKAWQNIAKPFHEFMLKNAREKDLSLFSEISKITVKSKEEMPFYVLIPSFMLSELKRAFEIGFLIYLPFLIIDILVASVLMAMGMMMLPPVMISLPFKLIFFVLVDGWYMLCGSLVKSYGIG